MKSLDVLASMQVNFLCNALGGDALLYYSVFVVPPSARAGRDLTNDRKGDAGANLRPEIISLSSAILRLDKCLSNDYIRHVLRQELLQTTLPGVCAEG